MAIPKPKVFWPLTITTTKNKVYFRRGATNYTGSIAATTYYSAATLAAAVQTAMNLVDGANTYVVTVDATGHFTITGTFTFEMRWGTFLTSSAASTLGWNSVDTASATTQVAPRQHANGWYANVAVRNDTGNTFEEPNSVTTVCMGGQGTSIVETELTVREVLFEHLAPERTKVASQGSGGNDPTAMENWWRDGRGRFRYWPDAATEATSADYYLDGTVLEDGFKPVRMYDRKELYSVGPWKMRAYVA